MTTRRTALLDALAAPAILAIPRAQAQEVTLRLNGAIDAFWSLLWAATTLLIAERMWAGMFDTFRHGMRTIGLLALSYWWAIGIGAFCFALAGVAARLASSSRHR